MNERRMQSRQRVARWFVCLGLGCCLLGSRDALAGKWPGEGASFGGAIAAKVVGQRCPGVLSASDIAEIDAYIAKYSSESVALEELKSKQSGNKPFPLEQFRQSLIEKYKAMHREPRSCDANAAERAQDMVQRVRTAMAADGPLIRTNGAPHVGEATNARLTGVMCPGVLTGQELAQLEFYVGKYWMQFVKTASDEDTRKTMWHLKEAEATQMRGWDRAVGCTTGKVAQAKEVLARLPKEF